MQSRNELESEKTALEKQIEKLKDQKYRVEHKLYDLDEKERHEKYLAEQKDGIEFAKTLVGKPIMFGNDVVKHHKWKSWNYDYVHVLFVRSVEYATTYNIILSGTELYVTDTSARIDCFSRPYNLSYLNGTYKPGPNECYTGGATIMTPKQVNDAFEFYKGWQTKHFDNLDNCMERLKDSKFYLIKMSNKDAKEFNEELYDKIKDKYQEAYNRYHELRREYYNKYGSLLEIDMEALAPNSMAQSYFLL